MLFSFCSNRQVLIMSTRYEFARSGRDRSLLLIFPEGMFDCVPFEIRMTAPWVGCGFCEISDLRAADRWRFHQLGYAILREADVVGIDAAEPKCQAEHETAAGLRNAA
jgi:hypothetical protein